VRRTSKEKNNQPLTKSIKESTRRMPIEHVFGDLKCFRILAEAYRTELRR